MKQTAKNQRNKNKFKFHLIVFLGMITASLGLIITYPQHNTLLTWGFIFVFMLSNLAALFIR